MSRSSGCLDFIAAPINSFGISWIRSSVRSCRACSRTSGRRGTHAPRTDVVQVRAGRRVVGRHICLPKTRQHGSSNAYRDIESAFERLLFRGLLVHIPVPAVLVLPMRVIRANAGPPLAGRDIRLVGAGKWHGARAHSWIEWRIKVSHVHSTLCLYCVCILHWWVSCVWVCG